MPIDLNYIAEIILNNLDYPPLDSSSSNYGNEPYFYELLCNNNKYTLIYHIQNLFDKLLISNNTHISILDFYKIFPDKTNSEIYRIFNSINNDSKKISFIEFSEFIIKKIDKNEFIKIMNYIYTNEESLDNNENEESLDNNED